MPHMCTTLRVSTCDASLRELHSFPTRRSSDLGSSQGGARSRGSGIARRQRPTDGARPRREVWGGEVPRGRPHDARDRKSTRLNSSHANTSYAVLCLKKKKAT